MASLLSNKFLIAKKLWIPFSNCRLPRETRRRIKKVVFKEKWREEKYRKGSFQREMKRSIGSSLSKRYEEEYRKVVFKEK
jgi:hypothetical protein